MAKFRPFTTYLLSEMDALIERYGLVGPFLDGGCGPGYAAAQLSRRGWSGVAIDNSPTALVIARDYLAGLPGVELVEGSLESYSGGPFGTVVLLDVLEHIVDDEAVLRAVARLQHADGMLLLTVPTNQKREWRWDDDLWGHVRRYDPGGVASLLRKVGYEPLEMWDVTLPFFWLLRRCYTAVKRPPPITGTPRQRTVQGHLVNPWDFGPIYSLLSNTTLWRPLFAIQRLWRDRVESGHEMMVLARLVEPCPDTASSASQADAATRVM